MTILSLLMASVLLLPGENGTQPALGPEPFPDRMSAFVWRNWGLVNVDRLAEVVGAKPKDLVAMAEDFGLPAEPRVLPEWKDKGYITVVRRNWHLLPYGQLLTLLGFTREQFAFKLKEEDFLFGKLGDLKPKCDELKWNADEARKGRTERRRLARLLKANGFDPCAPEEPRFTFVKDISAVESSNRTIEQSNNSSSPFDFRLISSYFADYADPLADPEIGSFPEGLLEKLAAQGVNAVWMHTVLSTLAKDPKYPEFGEGCEARIAHLKKLVARTAKYGIKVYLYMNEPRAQTPAFFEKDGRSGIAGAPYGRHVAMCTSTPEVRRWLRESVKSVFSQVKGLGGIFTITMSENHTNCASHGHRETCPRCKGRSVGEILAEVNNVMIEGMRVGDPSAEALVWNWAWPCEVEEDVLSRLPKQGCRVIAVSEKGIPVTYGGQTVEEDDYSIAIVGPGEQARRFWRIAGRNGISSVAKVQANCSWELSSFPYLPTMDLVAEHARNLASEGVTGVMLSWSCGSAPAKNLSVYRDFRKGETTIGPVLDRIAAEHYGERAVPAVRRAWTAFSEGFRQYPFDVVTTYKGPQHWGPANPLYAKPTGYDATMVGIPYDDLHFAKDHGRWDNSWCGRFTPEVFVEQFTKVADGFAEGCRLFAAALPLMEGERRRAAEKELAMFRAEQLHFRSAVDQAKFILARDRGDRAEMKRLARRELEAAQAILPLVRNDSRIGYECSNHYYYVPQDLGEKILTCLAVMEDDPPAPETRLVARPMPPTAPEAHKLIKVFGRDYWTWFTDGKYVDPLVPLNDARDNPALKDLPVFRDCALDIPGYPAKSLPPGKATFRTLRENWDADPALWERIERIPKPGTPTIFRAGIKRRFESHVGEVDLDMEDYRAWRARHPEFWGWEAVDEWGNDALTLLFARMKNVKDPELRAKYEAEWGPRPTTRQGFVRFLEKFFRRQTAKYYGNPQDIVALRSCFSLDHIAAAWGAKQLWLETTDTTGIGDQGYRWDVSPAFIRGASRQFGVPWGWYVAVFLNGVRESDGTQMNESYPWLPPYERNQRENFAAFGGVSESIERRCCYYAYVMGAGGVSREGWEQSFFDRGPEGRDKAVLSQRGQNFAAFHDFTAAHPDRGVPYAPVALLTPFAEGYTIWGGQAWMYCGHDYSSAMMDAAFFTAVPGTPRGKGLKEKGWETALRNSPYAQMYDVLVPDSPQPAADFSRALASYPAAVLVGDYRESGDFSASLVDYVRKGGTLFVNATQIPGLFAESFTGVALGHARPCGSKALTPDGAEAFAITDRYELVSMVLKGARPLLVDESGNVLAAAHDVDAGRVIVTAPKWLVPTDGNTGRAMLATARGDRRHPFFDWIFTQLQADLCPISVKGDVLYGLNRTEKGWWVWAFNNKGVSKFADRHARVDHAYDTVVRVDAAKLGCRTVRELVTGRTPVAVDGSFAFPVPAGDFAIFELE